MVKAQDLGDFYKNSKLAINKILINKSKTFLK